MSPRKKSEAAFETIRIVGKKAQRLIDSARARMKKAEWEGEGRGGGAAREERTQEDIVVHLGIGSIVKAAFAILAIALFAFLCYQLRDKLLLFFLAIFIAVVIDPAVASLERWGLPRGFAILLVYVLALALLLFLIISLIPIIAEQIQQMALNLAEVINAFLADPTFHIRFLSDEFNLYLNTLFRQVLADVYTGGVLQNIQQFGQRLGNAAQGSLIFVVGVAGSVVQFVVQFILVLVLAFFLQLEKEKVIRYARVLLPYRLRRYADTKAEAIHRKLAQWIRGQLMLSLSIGILVFVALKVLKMPYALTLAVLAFFAEFIPVVGPIIAAVPSVFIALAQSGFLPALIVAVVYYGIQWCENNLLVPLIMQRAVGLSPIAVIFAMLVGVSFPETIHPVLGILLAVPVATIISIVVQDYRDWRGVRDE